MTLERVQIPAASAREAAELSVALGRVTDFDRAFAAAFFAPAIEGGQLTALQAEFLVALPFKMSLWTAFRSAKPKELEAGFLVLYRAEDVAPTQAERPGQLVKPAVDLWIGDAIQIEAAVGGQVVTLDREGLRSRARQVGAIQWPSGTLAGLLCTDEVRAWRYDLEAVVQALPKERSIAYGAGGVAARRKRAWRALGRMDQAATLDLQALEELDGAGHRVLEGLLVPGGRVWVPAFSLPTELAGPSVLAANLRWLDKILGTDTLPATVPVDDWDFVDRQVDGVARARPAASEAARDHAAALAILSTSLPRRERRLVELLAGGHDFSQAARAMKIKPATVRTMHKRILKKARRSKR